MDIEKLIGNLTEEQKAIAKQCKSSEEFLKLAGAEGIAPSRNGPENIPRM